MPEPKPALRSTPTPASRPAAPAPRSEARFGALQGADRRAPLAEQEARLTPALVGQPVGTAHAQATKATAAAKRAPRASSRAEDVQATLSGTREQLASAAERASDYHILLAEMVSNPCEARDAEEARWDASAYHNAEAAVATVGPLWTAASSVARLGDIRFTAAMDTLAQAGLMRPDTQSVDEDKLAAESEAFVEGARGVPMRPLHLGTGTIAPMMTRIEAASHQLNAAVAEQRAHLLRREADEARAEAEGGGGRAQAGLELLVDIVKFATAVGGLATPTPAGVIGVVGGALDLMTALTSSDTLIKRADALGAQATDLAEKARWFGFTGAIKGLTSECQRLGAEVEALDQDTAEGTVELRSIGREHDRGPSGKGDPETESHGAIGLHLGKVLEAQRMNAAALVTWQAVRSPMAAAQATAATAISTPRSNWQLSAIQMDARAASLELNDAAGFRNRVQARYEERQASLAGAFKTVVSHLSSLTERSDGL